MLQVAREQVAALIRADAQDVVPVTNATMAVNTIVANVTTAEKEGLILISNITYNAVDPRA